MLVSNTGSLTVTSVQSSCLCLTGLTHSLPASVPSQKRALSLLPAHLLMLFGRTKASALMPTNLPKEVLGHMSWVVVEVILPRSTVAACVSGYRRREEDVCHVSFVCCAFSSLYARSSGVWPVCPAPSWLFYFTLCLWILTSPSYSYILCLTSRFELLFLSLSLILSLSPTSLSLLVSLWCPHGWLNEWSHKGCSAHTHTLSWAVLCCWCSCSAYPKECDSDAKVGGIGPGGWLNKLTVASPTHSLSHGRYSDK